jgi:hypothetical protein
MKENAGNAGKVLENITVKGWNSKTTKGMQEDAGNIMNIIP